MQTILQQCSKKVFILLCALAAIAQLAGISPFASTVNAQQPKALCTAEQLKKPDINKPCLPPGSEELEALGKDRAIRSCVNSCTAQEMLQSSPIINKYVNPLIQVLTALIGIVVTISLVLAGVQYSAAGGDPSKVAEAKKRITNSIVAILSYFFLFGFIDWLMPGGVV